jgi:hypothetical protein
MWCKIFSATNRKELEQQVNEWLKTHPVTPERTRFQFSTVSVADADSYKLEHTLVLMYVPSGPQITVSGAPVERQKLTTRLSRVIGEIEP